MKTDEKTMTDDEAIEEVTKVGEYLANKQTAIVEATTRADGAELTLKRMGELAHQLVADGAVPQDMKPGHVLMAMQAGIDHGLSWLGGIQGSVVIDGNFSWKGVAAAALIRNSPVCKPGTLRFWCDGEADDGGKRGVATAWRVHYDEPDVRVFTMVDAKRAGLLGEKKKNWIRYPERMLIWRALGLLARDVFSDVLGGFPLAEEAIDFEPKRGRAQVSVRPDSPPPSAPDTLLDAIEGKATDAIDVGPAVVDAELVGTETEGPPATEQSLHMSDIHSCPHGIALGDDGKWIDGECEDCAREDKAAVLEAEAEEARKQR